jgi:RNA polymerase sigma factor (sigma-70 family)
MAPPHELRRWLATILEHTLTDFLRREQTARRALHRQRHGEERLAALPAADPTPSSVCRHREEEEQIRRLLDTLSPELRLVVSRYHWDQQTFRQIGKLLRLSHTAVRKQYLQAILQLRALLDALEGDDRPKPA